METLAFADVENENMDIGYVTSPRGSKRNADGNPLINESSAAENEIFSTPNIGTQICTGKKRRFKRRLPCTRSRKI